MLTTAQWKAARRVDHLSLTVNGHGFHPRFRSGNLAGRPDLKLFDPFVNDFWNANNNFDKVSALGGIVSAASLYVAFKQRYDDAVAQLLAAARADLDLICGATHALQRDQDIATLSAAGLPAQRLVLINVYYVAAMGATPAVGPIDADIDNHIIVANGLPAFTTARLQVNRQNAVVKVITDHNGQSLLMTSGTTIGRFDEMRLSVFNIIGLLNGLNPPGTVDVVYVESFSEDDVQGFTARLTGNYAGRAPARRPIVFVRRTPATGGALTHPTTLAHEMGHALCDCGAHATGPDDLMAGGANRSGQNLLQLGEMSWFRNNAFAV